MDLLNELYRLQASGVEFTVGNCWSVDPEDALAFANDKDAVFAKLEGVTREELIAYRQSDGDWVQCSATTRKGKRCANIACYNTFGVADWVAKQGSCCKAHQRMNNGQ
jgi:hypothetical protein